MGRLTRFQRQVADVVGPVATKEAVADAAKHFATSKGKILKALKASGVTPMGATTAPAHDVDGCHVKPTTFTTTGDASIKEAWIDETPYRNLWLTSNDGERVVVPRAQLQRFVSLLR